MTVQYNWKVFSVLTIEYSACQFVSWLPRVTRYASRVT